MLRNVPRRVSTARTGTRYLVVGGHGFLGSHVVEALLARGEDRIRVLDIAPSPLFGAETAARRVEFFRADVRDRERVREACAGVDTVIHAAAMVNFWADLPFEYRPIRDVNVGGTENVVAACVEQGVQNLLYTSSSAVVISRDLLARPVALADESAPYARAPYLCHYIETKVLAERAVLAANGCGVLSTAAVRPGGLYGPRDRLFTPLVAAGRPGIGLRHNIIDHIYVENVVHALLLLDRHLSPDSRVRGQAYFVTNYPEHGAPPAHRSHFAFTSRLFAAFGHRSRLAPRPLLTAMAWASQKVIGASRGRLCAALGDLAKLRPASLALTRGTYYFTHRKAAAEFGYAPLYPEAEAFDITVRHFGSSRRAARP